MGVRLIAKAVGLSAPSVQRRIRRLQASEFASHASGATGPPALSSLLHAPTSPAPAGVARGPVLLPKQTSEVSTPPAIRIAATLLNAATSFDAWVRPSSAMTRPTPITEPI